MDRFGMVRAPTTGPVPAAAAPRPVLLKFVTDPVGGMIAKVGKGRYQIVDFGHDGWHASFTATGGAEVVVPPEKGGTYHAKSRHAMAVCQAHFAKMTADSAVG